MEDRRESQSFTALPWASDLRSLTAEAATYDEAAGCYFLIDAGIPQNARAGYAALVVAYTRDGEPVTIFEDGAALLLVTSGGISAAKAAARRVLAQMNKLGLDKTLRVGVAGVDAHPDTLEARAREVAEQAEPGGIAG